MMSDKEKSNIVTLYDEEGKQVKFEHLDSFELNSNVYVVLLEILDDGEENDEVVILRLERSEKGEDNLIVIEDDDELQDAFKEFTMRLEDQYDFIDD